MVLEEWRGKPGKVKTNVPFWGAKLMGGRRRAELEGWKKEGESGKEKEWVRGEDTGGGASKSKKKPSH